ncbi:hypothetical protein HJC23_005354 [Cyclotella cryptica]|uniref:Uncharacterized protein n=1 Tax=Cyclotella cryptica TaxID=29204 RepID=A0ABD3PG51_9STRA
MISRLFFIPVAFALLFNNASSWYPKRTNLRNYQFVLSSKLIRGGSIDDASQEDKKRLVLLIDVDNTLYSEREIIDIHRDNPNLNPWQRGIESQIIRNTHLFGMKYFNLTSQQCDELYKLYGTTVEGIRHMINSEKDVVTEVLSRFYKEVYESIDFSCFFVTSRNDKNDSYRSGYDHGHAAFRKRRALADFLKAISDTHSVYFTSNSPRTHVLRVLNAMGLRSLKFAGILTPDVIGGPMPYPTKSSPFQYYHDILERHPLAHNDIVLLDDSLNNIRAAESVGIRGIHVSDKTDTNSARTFEEGLAEALGHILPSLHDITPPEGKKESFTFSDVRYLEAKNKVDFDSIDPDVWVRLANELAVRMQHKRAFTIKVADLGAGILSMLELMLLGGGRDDRAKLGLMNLVHDCLRSKQKHYEDPRILSTHLEYYAYETNLSLLQACKERLEKLGFEEHEARNEIVFRRLMSFPMLSDHANHSDDSFHSPVNVDVTVHLRALDFSTDANPPSDLDLIMGCCFADLFDPDLLTKSLLRLVTEQDSCRSAPLIYFPITFTGTTQFSPAHPSSGTCPSDTSAFRIYSESLKSGREMLQNNLDSDGWIKRCRLNERKIIVSNVDLLFRLEDNMNSPPIGDDFFGDDLLNSNSTPLFVQEIQFVSPYNVTAITKVWDTSKQNQLGPKQVEIESIYSLISSGTELKIFKGLFESAALDVNIKGMSDDSMEYPLSYGYSLVGRVVACGAEVDDSKSIIGKLAFVFSPHSSRVIVDRESIRLVPDGIGAEDAIFMPSVETALSLVHDANIRVGENVAVYGQGLIGLLVTAILSMPSSQMAHFSSEFCSVTSFDTIGDRIRVSSMMGATNALHPDFASAAGPFDVSIEVSGNPVALQSAIDNTSDNGRIIVGSWYGNSNVTLKLGIDFHRSHKTIQTSQVSNIPCALTGLWSKERRFALTWALVKAIHPSRLISKRMTLDDAQHAYELLDQGREIAICFSYTC